MLVNSREKTFVFTAKKHVPTPLHTQVCDEWISADQFHKVRESFQLGTQCTHTLVPYVVYMCLHTGHLARCTCVCQTSASSQVRVRQSCLTWWSLLGVTVVWPGVPTPPPGGHAITSPPPTSTSAVTTLIHHQCQCTTCTHNMVTNYMYNIVVYAVYMYTRFTEFNT